MAMAMAMIQVNRGFSYLSLEMYENALQDFTQAISIDCSFGAAFVGRALVHVFHHCESGGANDGANRAAVVHDLTEAVKLLSELIGVAAHDPSWWVYRAQAHRYLAAFNCRPGTQLFSFHQKRMLKDVEEALKLNPQLSAALIEQGLQLLELGRFREAQADFQQALKLSPRSTSPQDRACNRIDSCRRFVRAACFGRAVVVL